MPTIVDISVELSSRTTVWPGSPVFRRSQLRNLARDGVNVSAIAMDVHTGTHVDAPLHHLVNGYAVSEFPLQALIGPAQVIDITDAGDIGADLLEDEVDDATTRLLMKTRNSSIWTGEGPFTSDYVGLTSSGAAWIAERKLLLVGNDYLSIQRPDADPEIHRILMQSDVVILEGITLAHVAPGSYILVCAPLKIAGAEGAPARAMLIEGSLDEI